MIDTNNITKDEQFFGIVQEGKFKVFAPQRLEGDLVRLTPMAEKEAKSPESDEIDLSGYEGKIIEVSGEASSGWIYSAKVVEEAGPVLSDFLRKVFCKEDVTKKKCALVIDHKKDSPGGLNEKNNINEFEFNEKLVPLIEEKVKNTNVQRVYRRTYAGLPGDINSLGADFVVGLHCNTGDGTVSGSEVSYHHKSLKGRILAEILLKHLTACLELPDRGAKTRSAEDKGGYLLCYTEAPCVIAEPFFIDNDEDLTRAMKDLDGLAEAFAKALDEFSAALKVEEQEHSIAV